MFELFLERPYDLKMKEMVSVPAPKDHEVKLRVLYGGICGSDLRVYKGNLSYANYPSRPGHEILGTVIEAGPKALHRVGTRVVSYPNTYCGACEFCLQGKTNICIEKKSFGVTANGLFAQEITIDSEFVVSVPFDLPDERAILIEPFAVTVHALNRTSIKKGMSVAVIGCGTEGLLSIALLNHIGVNVTAMDVIPGKMERAKGFGDQVEILHPHEVKDRLFEVVVEAAGTKSSIEQAFHLVKPGGAVISLGLVGEEVQYPALRITRGEISIYGTIIYTKKDFTEAIALLKNPAFHVGPLISKVMPFTQYQEAFDDALTGNFAKIVLDFKKV